MPTESRQRGFALNGRFLRELRSERQLTQSQAAAKAGISERALRKAEAGVPVDAHTATILAKLYSTEKCPIDAQHLLAANEARRYAAPLELVEALLEGIWKEGRLTIVEELCVPQAPCHSELGTLHSSVAIQERFRRILQVYRACSLTMLVRSSAEQTAAIRWQVSLTLEDSTSPRSSAEESTKLAGATSVRVEHGQIVELWDYWEASCQMPPAAAILENRPPLP